MRSSLSCSKSGAGGSGTRPAAAAAPAADAASRMSRSARARRRPDAWMACRTPISAGHGGEGAMVPCQLNKPKWLEPKWLR
eukprot:1140221-Lingulodinium_polyedra.AAC.1